MCAIFGKVILHCDNCYPEKQYQLSLSLTLIFTWIDPVDAVLRVVIFDERIDSIRDDHSLEMVSLSEKRIGRLKHVIMSLIKP